MKQALIAKIEKIMNDNSTEKRFLSFENFLFLLSKIYCAGLKLRTGLYKFHIIKKRKLPCYVISVGNIITGGTGKTPMTLYLVTLIEKFGYKTVIITRGYKGKYKEANTIVSNGSKLLLNVEEAGDEAIMMAEKLKIPVIVGKNRYRAGMLAIKKFNPDVIILDDAFQHIALERNLNLLLCDYKNPFGNFELLPRGRLREPVTAVERSDAIIFTRTEKQDKPDHEMFLSKSIFYSYHLPYIAEFIHCTSEDISFKKRYFLFSAISDNSNFRKTCKTMGMAIAGFVEFTDHHWYTKRDLNNIYENFKKTKSDCLVTTEKDYVKIKGIISDQFPLIVIGVKIEFKRKSQEKFEGFIKACLHGHLKVDL